MTNDFRKASTRGNYSVTTVGVVVSTHDKASTAIDAAKKLLKAAIKGHRSCEYTVMSCYGGMMRKVETFAYIH